MARSLRLMALGAVACAAGLAAAQPTLTSLGSGSPNSVTNNLSGTQYVGGANITTNVAGRWSLSGSTLTATDIGGVGSGLVSADGQWETVLVPNNSPRIFGNTATGISPPFNPNPTLVPSTSQPGAGENCLAIWNAGTHTLQRLG